MMALALILVPLALAALAYAVPSDRYRPWLMPPGAVAHLLLVVAALQGPDPALGNWLILDPLGKVFLVKQSEEHFGPHMPWFWDVNRSGGGVLLDMGCHSIEYARWVFGKPRVKSVLAQMGVHVHADKTRGEDQSLCIVEYEGGRVGLAENSWAKQGGVDDRCEIYGSAGFTRADLLRGSSLLTYSETGYGYAFETAATTRGYTFTMFE